MQKEIGAIEGIKIFGEINKVSDSTSMLKLTTKFRIELIFICVFWLAVIMYQIFGNEEMPMWINMIMFPGMLIWFWFVYRLQERSLLRRVESKIKKYL